MDPDWALVAAVIQRLEALADPGRAPGMQAYMKSSMPYLGVAVSAVRAVTKEAARQHPPASVDQLGATVIALWRGATHREHRYAATELTGLGLAAGSLALLSLYKEMIVTGAWWDHVDRVAPRLGQLLVTHPAELTPLLLAWSTEPDRWLRRGRKQPDTWPDQPTARFDAGAVSLEERPADAIAVLVDL